MNTEGLGSKYVDWAFVEPTGADRGLLATSTHSWGYGAEQGAPKPLPRSFPAQ